MTLLKSEAQDRDEEIRTLKSEKAILAEELTRALEEKEVAQKESRRAMRENDATRANAVRLERLVRMLRDRLERNGDYGDGSDESARPRDELDDDGGLGSGESDSFDDVSDRSRSPFGSLASEARSSRATHL